MLKKINLILVFATLIFGNIGNALAFPSNAATPRNKVQLRASAQLKKYMGQFGSLVAGIEIAKYKESANPDWEALDLSLKEMSQTLGAMQKADSEGNYREYTQALAQNFQVAQSYADKKDKKFFDAFDKMTQTCFQCHAAHRPSDFLEPKEKSPRLGQGTKTSFLFHP